MVNLLSNWLFIQLLSEFPPYIVQFLITMILPLIRTSSAYIFTFQFKTVKGRTLLGVYILYFYSFTTYALRWYRLFTFHTYLGIVFVLITLDSTDIARLFSIYFYIASHHFNWDPGRL